MTPTIGADNESHSADHENLASSLNLSEIRPRLLRFHESSRSIRRDRENGCPVLHRKPRGVLLAILACHRPSGLALGRL